MNTGETLALATSIMKSWDWDTEVSQPSPNQLDVKVNALEDLVPIVVALRVQRLGYLSAIVGLDLGPQANQMEVLYHFCPGAAVITLRVHVPRDGGAVPSLCEVIPSAEVFERELHEMFGINVVGLHTLEHLYLPEDWPDGVYPMRKDFDPAVLSRADKDSEDGNQART